MKSHKVEGIVLHSLPFKDFGHILTVFTLEMGISKFIIKGSSKTKAPLNITPYMCAEFVYKKSNSDLLQCLEVSILDQFLSLRNSLNVLKASAELAQTVLETQLPSQINQELYLLFKSYLKQLYRMKDPSLLVCSFKLKLLWNEGLFPEDWHAHFKDEEAPYIVMLMSFKKYTELIDIELPLELKKNVHIFMQQQLHA